MREPELALFTRHRAHAVFRKMGDRQRAGIMFSPVYAKEFSGSEAVSTELRKIAERLTSTL